MGSECERKEDLCFFYVFKVYMYTLLYIYIQIIKDTVCKVVHICTIKKNYYAVSFVNLLLPFIRNYYVQIPLFMCHLYIICWFVYRSIWYISYIICLYVH